MARVGRPIERYTAGAAVAQRSQIVRRNPHEGKTKPPYPQADIG
jgi:hypothetical protein